MNVFIADDHPVVTLGVSAIINRQADMTIVGTANNGEALFNQLQQVRPDVLLLDLNMPGDDFTFNLQRIRSDFPNLKIVIYTQYDTPSLVRDLLRQGVNGFLPKRASDDDICTAIRQAYEGQRYIHPDVKLDVDITTPDTDPSLSDDFRKRLGLSKREQEILVLISKGLTSQLIGKTLYISKHTVETHRKNILRKLDFNSSTELVKFAVQQGLV